MTVGLLRRTRIIRLNAGIHLRFDRANAIVARTAESYEYRCGIPHLVCLLTAGNNAAARGNAELLVNCHNASSH